MKEFTKPVLLGLAVGAVLGAIPLEIMATTTDFGAQDVLLEANKIKDYMFGPITRLAGILGGGYGLLTSVLTSSIKPLVTYGGIGLCVGVIPEPVSKN